MGVDFSPAQYEQTKGPEPARSPSARRPGEKPSEWAARIAGRSDD